MTILGDFSGDLRGESERADLTALSLCSLCAAVLEYLPSHNTTHCPKARYPPDIENI